MMRYGAIAGLIATGLVLSGCGGASISRIMGGDPAPQQQQINAQAAPDLSMPPDLQLRPPGTGSAPAPAAPAAQYAAAPQQYEPEPGIAPAPAAPAGDVYERNGISKYHPDGKEKTKAELEAELKRVYLAKKKQANPNYGTVFNIGNIFKDE